MNSAIKMIVVFLFMMQTAFAIPFWEQICTKASFELAGWDMPGYERHLDLRNKWILDMAYLGPQMHALLENPRAFLQENSFQIIKYDKSKRKSVLHIKIDGAPYIVKRYHRNTLWRGLKNMLRVSGAFCSWNNAHMLRRLGINTPAPVAAAEMREGFFVGTGYYITPYVEDEGAQCEALSHVLEQLKELRIVHGDLKAENFIFKDQQLYLIDLDRMYRYPEGASGFESAHKKDLKRLAL